MTRTAEPPATEAAQLTEQLAASVPAPTGVRAAVALFSHHFDDETSIIWTAKGPSKSKIVQISALMADMGEHGRRVFVVTEYTSGAFKVFGEVAGKDADTIMANVASAHGVEIKPHGQ